MILKRYERAFWIVFIHGLGVTERIFFNPKKEWLSFLPLRLFFKKGDLPLSEQLKDFNIFSWTQKRFSLIKEEAYFLEEVEKRLKLYSIVAHSRGGLIARFAIQALGIRPKALICLSTPHRGSGIADFLLKKAHRLLPSDARKRQLEELSRYSPFLEKLNENVELERSVPHFDIAGTSPFSFLRFLRPLIGDLDEIKEGKGDGLVSLESAISPLTPEKNVFCLPLNHANILVDREVGNVVIEIHKKCISKDLE